MPKKKVTRKNTKSARDRVASGNKSAPKPKRPSIREETKREIIGKHGDSTPKGYRRSGTIDTGGAAGSRRTAPVFMKKKSTSTKGANPFKKKAKKKAKKKTKK